MPGRDETFRIAFDGGPWERPPHSMRRVLALLMDAASQAGWSCELWTRTALQPEYTDFANLVRQGPAAWRDSDADVFWCPGLPDKPSSRPVVCTIHDVNPLLPDGRPWPARLWRRIRFRTTINAALGRSMQVVTDTEFARHSIEEAFPSLHGRITVVPLHSDNRIRRVDAVDRDAALVKLGLKPGYLLFVGSLRRHKNWEGLVRAYAALSAPLRAAHPLVLAGPAHRAADEAGKLIRSLGVEDQVAVLGTVPDPIMPAIYSGADLFVFPSFMEGFGLPPLEAMSCGVPVVATNRTSVPEVLGDAALYADPADLPALASAMRRVLEDPALSTDLSRRGAARAASYSAARTAAAMRPVLQAARVEKTLRAH